jgi:hypothetical protein
MNTKRMNRPWLRVAVAIAFGFMSLGHGPVMTFAHAASHGHGNAAAAGHQPADATHASHGHRHHAVADAAPAADCHDQDTTAEPALPASHGPEHDAAPCNAFGCFVSVAAPGVIAPAVSARLLGRLKPLPPKTISPAFAEPVDPPPRLHG